LRPAREKQIAPYQELWSKVGDGMRRIVHFDAERHRCAAGRLCENLLRYDVIVIDELGYLPFSQSGGQLLFHLISKRGCRSNAAQTRFSRASPGNTAGPTAGGNSERASHESDEP
jgi:hypothetical protein